MPCWERWALPLRNRICLAAAQSFIPDKGLGVKVGAVIGQVEAGHGIEVVGALEITEG